MAEPSIRRRAAPVRSIARRFEEDLSPAVVAAGNRLPNVRQISERVAMGRALWRELVIGFASQLGDLRLGFTQLAALYVLADGSTITVGELAESLGRSPSATSRLVDGLAKRRLVETLRVPARAMGVRHDGLVTGTGRFTLQPLDDDRRTRFTWQEELTFPWWLGGPVGERIGGRAVMRRIWRGNLQRLRTLVERRP